MKLEFGKFKGKEIEDVPTSYLEWCLGNLILSDQLQTEMEAQLKLRIGEGVLRSKDYIEKHSMKFKEDEQE